MIFPKNYPLKEFIKTENYSISTSTKNISSKIKVNLKKQDIKLIKALFKDSAAGLLELSEQSGLSIEGVRKKIKHFTESGLIKTNIRIDKEKVGTNFWVQLVLRIDHILKHMDQLKRVLSEEHYGRSRRMFGSWNLETTLLANKHSELIGILNELEKFFGKDLDYYKLFITSENILPYRLPKVLFKE